MLGEVVRCVWRCVVWEGGSELSDHVLCNTLHISSKTMMHRVSMVLNPLLPSVCKELW